jgi:hypothetical protein
MMNILQAQMQGVANKDRSEPLGVIDQHAPATVTRTFHSTGTNGRERYEEPPVMLVKSIEQPVPVPAMNTFPSMKISSGSNNDEERVMIRRMMNVLQTMMSEMAGKDTKDPKVKKSFLRRARSWFFGDRSRAKDEDEKAKQLIRQMIIILQEMMSDEKRASFSLTGTTPATKINGGARDEDVMAKQIMREMMNILRARMRGKVDKDKNDMLSAIDQQMMMMLQDQKSGMAGKDGFELVKTINQPTSDSMTFPYTEINHRGKEDEKAKEVRRTDAEEPANDNTGNRMGLVNVIEKGAPVSVERISSAIKINRRGKDEDEKAKEIMKQIMNILQQMMSGKQGKDGTSNRRGKDESEMAKQITQRINILQRMMAVMDYKDRVELVRAIDELVPEKGNMVKQIMRQMMSILQAQTSDTAGKEKTDMKISIDQHILTILQAQMSDMPDRDRTAAAKVGVTRMAVQDDEDCIKADGPLKDTMKKLKHIKTRADDGDEEAKKLMRQINLFG